MCGGQAPIAIQTLSTLSPHYTYPTHPTPCCHAPQSLRAEVKQAKHKLHVREAYFENFTTQLFRQVKASIGFVQQYNAPDKYADALSRLFRQCPM